jgi:SAM-dependent methyltransferase
LLSTQPRPDDASLSAAYSTAYYAERGMLGDEAPWRDRAQQVLAALGGASCRRVLDVGAGDGALVWAMEQLGRDAVGVEPAAAARTFAREHRGVTLFPSLDDVRGPFDGAVLLHVLEHLDDPVASLRAVRAQIRASGALFVEVPNAGSVDLAARGIRRDVLDLPFHLHHFTPRSLRRVVEAAGFAVEQVSLPNPAMVEWALARRHGAPAAERERDGPPAGIERRAAPSASPQAEAWRRALPVIRRVFPGHRIRLRARCA